jgi:peptidoglycan/LPS O-acetylase OafA/YrhL
MRDLPPESGPSLRAAGDHVSRIAGLDIGRLCACLAVALFHGTIDLKLTGWITSWGYVGVEFFMMLSGYVLARPYLETFRRRSFHLRQYLGARAARIVPPYYVVVAVAALLTLDGHGSSATPVTPAQLPWHVAAHATFIHPLFAETNRSIVSVLWSMGVECHYYLVFPLLLVAFGFGGRRASTPASDRRAVRPLLALAALSALSVTVRVLLPVVLPGRPDLVGNLFLARGTEFVFGVALAALIGIGWSRGRLLALAAFLGALGVAAAVAVPGPVTREFGVQGVIAVLFTGLRAFGPLAAASPVTRSLQFLGEASYSTYLVHTLAGKAMLAIIGAHGGALGETGLLIAYVLAGQTAGVAFYLTVEKPVCRWAGGILGVRPSTATVPPPARAFG